MEIYKFQQILVLSVCTLAGGLCGIVYDIFRAYRRCTVQTSAKTAVCDILFWTVSAVIVYLTIHLSNNAELRWYEPAGVITGYVLYTLYLSKYLTALLCKFIKFPGRIYHIFLKLSGIPSKILHILILPFERCSLAARTRLLYLRSNMTDRLKTEVSRKIKSGIVKKLRK